MSGWLSREAAMLELNIEQKDELRGLMRRSQQAHLRIKAAALWNLGGGRTQKEVCEFLGVSRASLRFWAKRYLAEGAAGLAVRPGRGRKAQADEAEVARLLEQSPREYGIAQTRWTLMALAKAAPSLAGFSPAGVMKVLRRMGMSHKRGQPYLYSPDPEYSQKRGPLSRR
jgi:transposase